MASWGGEKRGGAEGSPKPAVYATRKTRSVGSQEDQWYLGYPGDQWSSGFSYSWWKNSVGSESKHGEGALDQPQHDVHLEDLGELHRAARSGDVPGVEHVLAPGDTGVDKRDRKKSIQQLVPEYKEKQTPESLPQNNNPAAPSQAEGGEGGVACGTVEQMTWLCSLPHAVGGGDGDRSSTGAVGGHPRGPGVPHKNFEPRIIISGFFGKLL
ncbi:CCDC144NL isoform 2 [Pan troglodytes]|uniref:CCDC144NL isoform 2 n=1 Tax=Pan troglodytes TaxID=9598 RepID=A0A2J8J3D5_PANTR|nr:CCDC144NL isoform 2 [Pan troglodytes]